MSASSVTATSTQYRITVSTGDVCPDSARFFVYISLVGSLGATPEVRLNTRAQADRCDSVCPLPHDSAESDLVPLVKKSTNVFVLNECLDIGSLDKVLMRLESETGLAVDLEAVGWLLERVAVENVCEGAKESGTEWAFSVNRWVNQATDHIIELQRAMATEILLDDRGSKVVRVRLAMHHLPSELAHEEIYVSGSIPELGSWNVDRAVRMEKVQPVALAQKEGGRRSLNRNSWHGDWEYCFTLDPEAASDFDYKYFIRNHRTNAMVWEHGPNRKMIIERIASGGNDANITLRLNDQWNTPTLCRKVLNSYLVNGIMSPLSKILGSSEDGVMAAVRRIRNELEEMRRENTTLRSMLQAQSDRSSPAKLTDSPLDRVVVDAATDVGTLPAAVEKINLSQLSFHAIEQAPSAVSARMGLAFQLRQTHEQIQMLHAMLEQLRVEARASSKSVAHLIGEQGEELQRAVKRCQAAREQAMALWRKEFQWRRKLFNRVQEITGNIRVFCRVRPTLPSEADPATSQVIDSDKIVVRHKVFEFDRVFGPGHTQEQVYEDTSPLVTCAMDGYNVCIFAYGQTGSGKTYTMTGPPESRGVNHRALAELFRLCDERSAAFIYTIQVSMLEIYNECIRDLVTGKTDNRLEIKLGPDGNPFVPDLIWIPVESLQQVWSVIDAGTRNRAQGSTRMNIHSSRSHLIVSIMIEATNRDTGDKLAGKLHLVDLAGSERVSRSEAEGERLREAQHINKSLSALGDVFMALLAKQSHVPYRNSKLTFLLQDSLGGDSKTLMFVNVSPAAADEAETLSSLMFAQRVAKVELPQASRHGESAAVAKYMKAAAKAQEEIRARDEEIVQLHKQIEQLRSQLASTRSVPALIPSAPSGSSLRRRCSTTLATPSEHARLTSLHELNQTQEDRFAVDDKENHLDTSSEPRRFECPAVSAQKSNNGDSLHVDGDQNQSSRSDEEARPANTFVGTRARRSQSAVSSSSGHAASETSTQSTNSATALQPRSRRSSSHQSSNYIRSPLAAANRDNDETPRPSPTVPSKTTTAKTKATAAAERSIPVPSSSSPIRSDPGTKTTTTTRLPRHEAAAPAHGSGQRVVLLRETRADLLRRQANEAKRNGTPSRVHYAFGSRIERSITGIDSASPSDSRRRP